MGSIETGERIAALRKIKGWSQSELGEKIGLTQASVSEIERGVKRESVESLKAIADALDTDIGYLLTGKEPNKELPKYYMRVGSGLQPPPAFQLAATDLRHGLSVHWCWKCRVLPTVRR